LNFKSLKQTKRLIISYTVYLMVIFKSQSFLVN
jgi:hypothetical protein